LLTVAACDLSQPHPNPTSWDSWSTLGPSVLLANDQVRLWYYGTSSIQSTQPDLGLATGACTTSSPCAPGAVTRAGALRTTSGAALGEQSIASDPSVLFDGTTYGMWFTSVELNSGSAALLGTAYTTSTDGSSWNTPTYNVLVPTAGTFDAGGVETPSVLSAGGELKLYYTGDSANTGDGNSHQAIGLATSSDGVQWTKAGSAPVFDSQNSWEQGICANPPDCTASSGGVGEPTVVFDGNAGVYRLWYAALGTLNGVDTYRIGYATSPDGLAWTRLGNPVFDVGPSGTWDDGGVSQPDVVPDPAGGFHLFYFGFSASESSTCSQAGGCAFLGGSVGHAFSTDGVSWARDAAPLLQPAG
jgi:hypothetical protein